MSHLNVWSEAMKASPPALAVVAKFLDASIEATTLIPVQEKTLRSGNGIDVLRRRFSKEAVTGRERFLQEIHSYLAPLARLETTEFEIVGIRESAGLPPTMQIHIRYDFVGTRNVNGRDQRVGTCKLGRTRNESNAWRAMRCATTEETLSQSRKPVCVHI